MCAPWGLYQGAFEEIQFHYLMEGECYLWVGSPNATPLKIVSGDFILIPRGIEHGVASSPDNRLAETHRICYSIERGHYKYHDGPGKECLFLCGAFSTSLQGADVLLRSLPEVLVVNLDDTPQKGWIKSTLQLVEHETHHSKPGQDTVIAELLDVLFIQLLKLCCDQEDLGKVGLLGAVRDPDLCAAMKAILEDIRHPWQLQDLAQISGLSRATFAERFARIVGESPMSFIRMERLRRSTTLLEQGILSVKEVANRVGFSRVEVFIRSFEKTYGCSPTRYRSQLRAVS